MLVGISNDIISKFKGEDFRIDGSINSGYLLHLLISKSICFLWGIVRLRSLKRVFIHPSSKIRSASNLKFGKNLQIGRNCFVDALSKNGLILGDNCSMGDYTYIKLTGSFKQIANGVKIGNNVGLGSHGFYGCGVGTLEIGDDCIFGNYVSIHPENHIYSDRTKLIRLQGVNSWGG